MKRKKTERPIGPAEELHEKKLADLKKDFKELESYKQNKITLQYPTFFVPGWTSEDCAAWKEPYKENSQYAQYYCSIKTWIENIITNSDKVRYVTFLGEKSSDFPSFMELGKALKTKIINIVGENPINLVGHSMGGLDIRAAILDDERPVLNVKNVITVGTPNNGVSAAGLVELKAVRTLIKKFVKSDYHIEQCRNMGSNSRSIKEINTDRNLRKLLDKLDAFYVFMGLRDPVAGRSPIIKKGNLPEDLYNEKIKSRLYQAPSAEHSGKDSITQDARFVLRIIRILTGNPIVEEGNKGYIYKKS